MEKKSHDVSLTASPGPSGQSAAQMQRAVGHGLPNKKGYYITTAIAYPNNKMHVGFAWEVLGADVLARTHRMMGRSVFFSTGLDEHSQNVEKAAHSLGEDPQTYCDRMAADIRKIMSQLQASFDRFIRTSDEDHQKVCKELLTRAFKHGDVYKKQYEGLYCDSCETFYTEKDLVHGDGQEDLCPTHRRSVRKVSEENYFFALSRYQQDIERLLERGFLQPEHRCREIQEFVKQGLQDFSVSRTSFRFGIPIPWDQTHVIYVWYDALINYLSAIGFQENPELFGEFWPCDVHVVGKDITRFHCVYWPAMLMSTQRDGGVPVALPARVWAHGFISYQGEKMSKTRGNVITPDAVMADYGVNALRWFLLAANPFDGDGNYSDDDLIAKWNADLCNNIGNLVNRTVNMVWKYFSGTVRSHGLSIEGVSSVEQRWVDIFGSDASLVLADIENMSLMAWAQKCMLFAQSLNKMIDETKPWALAKDPVNRDCLESVLSELCSGICALAGMLWPFIPSASESILQQMGQEDWIRDWSVAPKTSLASEADNGFRGPSWSRVRPVLNGVSFSPKQAQPLFARIERDEKPTTSV